MRQVADGLHVMFIKGDESSATLALVDSPCDLAHLAEHEVDFAQRPDIRLEKLLENGTEPALLIENRWILSCGRSYKLWIGEQCVFQLVNQRQQCIVLPNMNA